MDSSLKKCILSLSFLILFSTVALLAQEGQEPQAAKEEQKVEKVSQEQITKWIEQLASQEKQEVENAIAALSAQKEEAFPVILANLHHTNKVIRWQCLQLVSEYTEKAQEILPSLLKQIKEETESDILRKIIALLGASKSKEASDALLACVDHADASVRSDVLWTLAVMGEKTLNSILIDRLKVEKSPEVKATIFRTLAVSKDEVSILTALDMFPDQTLQEDKTEVLMAYCDCAAVIHNSQVLSDVATGSVQDAVRTYALEKMLPLITEKNAGLLIPVLWDSQLQNRSMAFKKLIEITVQSFDYDPQGGILERSVAIGKWEEWWKTVELISAFNKAEKEQQPELKKQLLALGEHTIPYFIESYSKLTPANQAEIIKMIARWNKPEVVDHLVLVVSKEAGEAKEEAIQILAVFYAKDGNKKIEKIFKDAFAAAHGDAKAQFASYLAVQNDLEAMDFLKKSLQEENQALLILNLLEKNKIYDIALNPVVLGYLKNSNEETKKKAFSYLLNAQKGSFLAENFASLDQQEKLALIEKLAEENKASLEKLLPFLNSEKDNTVKIKLCDAVSDMANAKQEISKALEAEVSADFAKSLLNALKKQNTLIVSALIESFKKQKESATQEALLDAIPSNSVQDAASFLKEVLQGSYSEEVRTQALKKLLYLEKTEDVVKNALETLPLLTNESLRLAWLGLLKNRTKEEHLPLLETLWKNEKQSSTRAAIVSLWNTMPYSKVLSLIQTLLEQEKELEVKKEALEILLSFKKDETFDFMVKLSEKSEPALKKLLYSKLADVDSKKALPLITKALESETPEFGLYSLLATHDKALAKKLFSVLLTKAKTQEEKALVLKSAAVLRISGVEYFDLLMGMLPAAESELANLVASTLDQICNVQSGYSFDKKEDQEKALLVWQNWKKEQDLLQSLVKNLFAADSRNEAEKQLLSFGEKGLLALAKAFPLSKSSDEKIAIVYSMVQFAEAAKVLRPLVAELDTVVRGKVYSALQQLQDASFLKQIPFFYLKETSKDLRVLLLSLMSEQQLSLYEAELPGYLQYPSCFDLLAQAIQKSSLKNKNGLLIQLAEKLEDDAAFIKVFGMISADLKTNKVATLTALLQKHEKPQIIEAILANLKNVKALANAPVADKATYLVWYKNNTADLEKQIALEKAVLEFLGEPSLLAEQKLQKFNSDEKKAVVAFLLDYFAQKEATVFEKANALKILASYESQEAQKLFQESLVSEHPALREVAARNLTKVGLAADSDVVKNAATHEDNVVRFFAIKAIGSKKVAALEPVLIQALEDKDVRVREEALYWLLQTEFKNQEIAKKVLQEKTPGMKSLAFTLAANLGITTAMKDMVLELANPFQEVRQAAYNALVKLSGQNFPYNPKEQTEKIQDSITKWQNWVVLFESKEEVAKFAALFASKDAEKESVVQKVVSLYKNANPLLQEEILQKVKSLLNDKNALVRTGMIAVVQELADKNLLSAIADLLLDEDAQVRETAYNTLAKMSSSPFQLEKLPAEYDAKAAEAWKEAVKKWFPQWQQEENKHLIKTELAKLEQDAKNLGSGDTLWAAEQMLAAQKTLHYLNHSLYEVRSQAWETVKRFAKNLTFRTNGTPDERKQDLEKVEKWLQETETKLQEENQSLKDKIAEIKKKPGNLNTPEGCTELQNLLGEMKKVDHPVLLKEYLNVLQQRGCKVFDYDVYAPSKDRLASFQKIAEFVYDYKVRLRNAQKDALLKEKAMQEAFQLKGIQNTVEVKLAQDLVALLSHDAYSLRKKASEVLAAMAGQNFGYSADAIEAQRAKAIDNWKEWLVAQEENMKKQRALYVEKIQSLGKTLVSLKKIENRDAYQGLFLLVQALKDKESVVREAALDALKSFHNGQDFGYQGKQEPQTQTESLEKWQKWLLEIEKALSYQENLEKLALELKGMATKVRTAKEAQKVETLLQALSSSELKNREIAFSGLSAYSTSHATEEVREHFGYDPVAPEEIRNKTVSDWKNWYENKVKVVALQEQERVNSLKTIIVSLLSKSALSKEDVDLLDKLVVSLEDVSDVVRNEAFQALKVISQGKSHDFDPAKTAQEQDNALKAWQLWLKREKSKIEEAAKARTEGK